MNILSIQSHVAYGHVGNASAVFPLQRLGFEVWPVHTVQFSNHVGYPDWSGQVFTAEHIREVIDGIEKRGVFPACDAVISGYMGSAKLGAAVLHAVERVRAANPAAVYACDPVMGDIGVGLYVDSDIVGEMRERAVPAADIITPNHFELEQLSGKPIESLGDAIGAARAILERGPKVVVVTSLRHADTPEDRIEMLAVTAGSAFRVSTPFLVLEPLPHGSGDATAALFLAHYLRAGGAANLEDSVEAGLGLSAAAIFAVMAETQRQAAPELALVDAQAQIAEPQRLFPVERLD